MASAQDEVRAGLQLLVIKIAEFEARSREATAMCTPGDPMLQSLHQHLDLLGQERLRLEEQLRNLG